MSDRCRPKAVIVLFLASCTVPNPNYRPRHDGGGDAHDGAQGFCDPQKPFGAPTLVPEINSSKNEFDFTTTRDDLTGFVSVEITPSPQDLRIEIAQRTTRTANFSAPQLGAAAAIDAIGGTESNASPVGDSLLLYFVRFNAGQESYLVASRVDAQGTYGGETPLMLDWVAFPSALSPRISSDGQTLYWFDSGDFKMRAATRGSSPSYFMNQRTVSTMRVGDFAISADELTLYYGSGDDIFVTKRTNTSTLFEPGIPVDGINTPQFDNPSSVSHDGCTLYFVSNRSGGLGGFDIWQARRP